MTTNTNPGPALRKIRTLRSHAAKGRYINATDEQPVGYIPRPDLPQPYAYSPTQTVWNHPTDGPVIIVETSHKRYEIFSPSWHTDEATAETMSLAYMKAQREAAGR